MNPSEYACLWMPGLEASHSLSDRVCQCVTLTTRISLGEADRINVIKRSARGGTAQDSLTMNLYVSSWGYVRVLIPPERYICLRVSLCKYDQVSLTRGGPV